MMRSMGLVAWLVGAMLSAACGSEGNTNGADGGVACGATTCAATELCVATTSCMDVPAGGCAAGTFASNCKPNSMPGCRGTALECKARPSGCDPISCACAQAPLCGACSCSRASETDVGCMCL
ncbi:MAG: hypothetical protein IT384_29775 [Deltaproteobacteria bacterium]|nr:hypothetical protein [Deltaproteobacteria bacterium]